MERLSVRIASRFILLVPDDRNMIPRLLADGFGLGNPNKTAALIATPLCLMLFTPHSPVTKRGNALVIGRGVSTTWVVADRVVLGKSFPRSLREIGEKSTAVLRDCREHRGSSRQCGVHVDVFRQVGIRKV